MQIIHATAVFGVPYRSFHDYYSYTIQTNSDIMSNNRNTGEDLSSPAKYRKDFHMEQFLMKPKVDFAFKEIMTDEKAEMIKKIRVDSVHFAWDRYEDKNIIIPKFKAFKEITGWKARKTSVYVLTNFNTTLDQDLERIYTLRDMDYDPYVMVYDKEHTNGSDPVRKLQRWVNNRKIFKTIKRFEDYDPKRG